MTQNEAADPEATLDAKDVARLLKVSSRTVLRLAERGELTYFRVGDLWRFQRKDVTDFIEKKKQRGKKQENH